ncbi:MAG: aspartate aminotransferase family protein [Chloroflexi bacterium]|nr:aspartate aminotransferase family protein [Chloroflexota bacterium]
MMDTATLFDLENRHGSGAYGKRPTALVRGEGVYAYDQLGNRYLDATSGQGVAALGHCHPAVINAIGEQAATLITCHESFYNDRRAALYQLLASITPADLKRFFLCNSGAEANEGALKVAKLLTGRDGIVAAKRSFHGRTTGALSLTWTQKYRKPFQEWLPTVDYVAFNDIEAARNAITEATAAVVVEAIQGEGGVHPADDEYLGALRERCDQTGAMLIIDEIQTGFGRTGRWFGFEHAGIVPDIISIGKAIAGGLPMGAVCWRDAHGPIDRATHGSTFGGNPLACAAALAAVGAIRDEGLVQQARVNGEWFIEELSSLNLRGVRQARGRGLMIGLELRGRVTPILKALQEQGVLALPAGLNTLRLLPPLIISREQLSVVAGAIDAVLG